MMKDLNNFIERCRTEKRSRSQVEKELLQLLSKGIIDAAPLKSAIANLDYLSALDIEYLHSTIDNSNDENDKTIIRGIAESDKTIIPGAPENDKTIIRKTTESDEQTVLVSPVQPDEDDKTILKADNTTDNDKTRILPPTTDKDATLTTALEKASPQTLLNSTTSQFPYIISTGEKMVAPQPGAVINNRFELLELLGRGGMGSVFKAKDKRKEEADDSNPYIAIKFLNEDFKQHPKSLISLQRECKKSQALAHPNIITVHDFDRDGDTVYMTMELMDGEPLDELLAKHKNVGLEHSLAINILDDMSQALSYAHKKNIVHSDFKPGNVFITHDGRAKVLDFGIARAVKHTSEINDNSDSTIFDAGELGGLTPAYASCEMLNGETPAPADDMYALGCVAYELFTGRHPFGRVQANRAKEKKLSVAPLKQLKRKQSQALLNALKFNRNSRTPDAQIFVREFFVKKQTSKGLVLSLIIAALLLAGIGAKLFLDHQEKQAITKLVNTINQGDSQTISATLPQISELDIISKETVLRDVRDTVINYYAKRALPLVDQNVGKYQFPQAMDVLKEAKSLYPDSAKIKDLIDQLQSRRNQLLNTLASQINRYVKAGKLHSKSTTDDINEVFDLIKVVDPQSKLLHDQRLQLAYSREIKKAFKNSDLKKVASLIKNGLSLFPASKLLTSFDTQLKDQNQQTQEDNKLAKLQKTLTEKGAKISDATRNRAIKRHKEKLATLIRKPFKSSSWVSNIQSEIISLKVFSNKKNSEIETLVASASEIILKKAKTERRNGNLISAQRMLTAVKKINPTYAALSKERRALAIAEKKQNSEQASLEKIERIKALQQTLLTQATANNVKDAKITFQTLNRLAPNTNFTNKRAREAIADAYIRLAKGLAARNNFTQALSLISSALQLAPGYHQLNTSKERYKAEIALLELRENFTTLEIANSSEIQKKLSLLRKGFPNKIQEIRAELSSGLLISIKAAAKINQINAKNYAQLAQLFFPENSDIVSLTKRSSKFQAAGGQPCKINYAGHGKRTRATCYDILDDGSKAPLLVVAPAILDGDRPFAVSKYEISISELNHYCNSTKLCKSLSGTQQKLPAINIAIETAQSYVKWLSEETHSTYRLPTNAEWFHAANAGGKQPKKDFNCRLTLGNKQIKGLNLINVQSGKQNGWGLKNYVGNVQEFSIENGKIYVNGGAYTDSFSQCDTTLRRLHNGRADGITGFRVVREL